MPKLLTDEQIAKYQRDGYVFPIRVFSEAEAAGLERRLRDLEAREGGAISRQTNMKPYLLVNWLNDVVRNTRILDAIEDILGPDLQVWSAGFFAKAARNPGFVSWHQDSTYWGLSSPDVCTAWVAFTPSTPESGCMRVIPGTHGEQIAHNDTFEKTNMLSRGQEIMCEVDESKAVDIVLRPGEMSLHHVRLIHGSQSNRANHRRVGFAIRYIPTHLRQLSPLRDSAMLVRGTDTYNHFDQDLPPESDFHPAAVARHAANVKRQVEILYAGAQQVRDLTAPVAPAA